MKDLTWSHIDLENRLMKVFQNKTDREVIIDLNDNAIGLLGERGRREELVFSLPSHHAAWKSLKVWVDNAGIDKHISWHCARHSFAVNLLYSNTDIKTVSGLLGHSGLKHTEKYTRLVDELKKRAVNNLPTFDRTN